ncbi:hypothetical protein Lalb_Chr09g0334681 [Lupinus albus]|uniref:Uncharacterized protein n=1 Tax=Lupinus albus TaxID=3870 RepID=A0A6A4Q2W6_LUPAL|nr:hypothetical protein Lalb_Chr09g0334681 [Lupinus albus]
MLCWFDLHFLSSHMHRWVCISKLVLSHFLQHFFILSCCFSFHLYLSTHS